MAHETNTQKNSFTVGFLKNGIVEKRYAVSEMIYMSTMKAMEEFGIEKDKSD